MHAQDKSFFYGWVVVGASAAIYPVMSASTLCFGLFIKPMTESFAWNRSDMVLAVSLYILVGASLFIVSGRICDRYGPRPVVFAGGLFLALGFFLCSRVNELWHFYLGFSVCGGIGLACIYVPLTATLPRWFVKHRGMALGIMYASGGVGGLCLAPILQRVIVRSGWQAAWLVLASLASAVIIPVTLALKKEPRDLGLEPLGAHPAAVTQKAEGIRGYTAPRNHTVSTALRSSQLWILSLSILVAMAGIMAAQHNMVPYATDKGVAAGTAALALGLASGFNAVGRISMGFISDRIGTRHSLFVTFLGAAVVLLYLVFVDRGWMLFVFAVFFGFVYGSTVPLMPRAVAELFGTENIGAIMGVLGVFGAIGPAFGPAVAAAMYDRTGSYSSAFVLAGTGMIVALALSTRLKLPRGESAVV